jgi:hypothetical protein
MEGDKYDLLNFMGRVSLVNAIPVYNVNHTISINDDQEIEPWLYNYYIYVNMVSYVKPCPLPGVR